MNYSIDDIKSLSFREGVRSRIQMYLGSDDNEGIYQALKEIINNSTDEALAGYGDKIVIRVNENTNEVEVTDYGRGVPFGTRENGENVLVSIYTKSHTGGKFTNDSYKNASGLNGIGGSCVCLSSDFFSVSSYRNGTRATATFNKGELTDYVEETSESAGFDKTRHGTTISFVPDAEVFHNGEIGYSYERICQDMKDISYLYPGIVFTVYGTLKNGETAENNYCAKNGIIDFIKENVKSPLNKQIIHGTIADENDSLEIAFQWGSKHETPYVFVNGLRCPEGGQPVTGARSALTRTFNSIAGTNYDGEMIRKNLFYVVNCKVANPSFANQTKSKINNANLRTLASTAFSDALKKWATQHPDDFKSVADMFKKVDRAEKAADRAREAILNHERESVAAKKQIISSKKLRDARKTGQNSILLLTEGLSAGGSMSIGRDPDKYGILMLRGKAINCLTNPIEDILANEEVKLLLQALGVTYGKKYNPNNLRYGKIAVATDADVDGI